MRARQVAPDGHDLATHSLEGESRRVTSCGAYAPGCLTVRDA